MESHSDVVKQTTRGQHNANPVKEQPRQICWRISGGCCLLQVSHHYHWLLQGFRRTENNSGHQ